MPKLNVDKARKMGFSDQEIEKFVRDNDLDIKSSVGGFGGSLFRSGTRMVGDTAKGLINIFNPNLRKNTIANLGRAGAGLVSKAIPGRQGSEDTIDALADYYGTRYGIKSALKGDFNQAGQDIARTVYFDPVGVAGDVAAAGGLVGGAAKGFGAASKTAKLSQFGDDIARFSNRLDPIYLAGSLGKRGVSNLGSKLDDLGQRYYTAGLGNPQTLGGVKKFRTSTGEQLNAADILAKLPDRSPDSARALKSSNLRQYGNIVKDMNIGGQAIFDALDQFDNKIGKLTKLVDSNPQNASLVSELDNLVNQRNNFIRAVQEGSTSGPITVSSRGVAVPQTRASRINRYKRSVTGTPSQLDSPNLRGANAAEEFSRNTTRSAINTADPRLEMLGLEAAALGDDRSGIIKVLESAQNRAESMKPMRISKTAGAGLGAGVGATMGLPGSLVGGAAGMLATDYLNSPGGIKTVGNSLRKSGSYLQNVPNSRGARATKSVYQYGLRPTVRASQAMKVERPGISRSKPRKTYPLTTQADQRQNRKLDSTFSNSTPQNTDIQLFTDKRKKRKIF